MSSRFKPQKIKTIDPVLSEKMKRTIRSYNAIHREYVPNKTEDKHELECSIYKQKFPDNVERKLMTLIRVRVPKGQFETDSSGTVDKEGKIKEALVYTVSEKVTGPDPNYPDSELIVNLAQCNTKMGYYTKPIANIRRDSLGNPVDSQVHSWVNIFYIPFTEENVRKILNEFDYSYKGLALAVAVQGYAEKFYGSFKYSVYNIENFIQADFDDLLAANKEGFLNKKDETYAAPKNLRNKLHNNKKRRRTSPMKGKHHTKAAKLKMSLANKGRKLSLETRRKISESSILKEHFSFL